MGTILYLLMILRMRKNIYAYLDCIFVSKLFNQAEGSFGKKWPPNPVPGGHLGHSGFGFKFVADAPDGLDVVAAAAEFGAEFLDMGVDRSGIAEIIVVPYGIKDLFS